MMQQQMMQQQMMQQQIMQQQMIAQQQMMPQQMMGNLRMPNIENDNEFFGLTKEEIKDNKIRERDGKIQIKPLGCGKELNWNEMEDCSDEVIEKLKEIAIDDYHAGLLKISEDINH